MAAGNPRAIPKSQIPARRSSAPSFDCTDACPLNESLFVVLLPGDEEARSSASTGVTTFPASSWCPGPRARYETILFHQHSTMNLPTLNRREERLSFRAQVARRFRSKETFLGAAFVCLVLIFV